MTPPMSPLAPLSGMPPAQMGQAAQPATPFNKQALIEALKNPLAQLVQNEIRGLYDPEKIWQYAKLRRMSLYVKGNQYLAYTQSGIGDTVDYRPIGANQLAPVTNITEQLYDYILNILKGDVRAFVAVLGSRAPNVQAQAQDLGNEAQVRRKMVADRVAAYLRSHWKMDLLHRDLAYGLATKGTMFSYVRYVANKRRYGSTTEPTYSVVDRPISEPYFQCARCGTETPQGMAHGLDPASPAPVCSGCGSQVGPEDLVTPESIPSLQITGAQTYDNGAVEIDLCSSTTVTAPFWATTVDNAPWWIYEFEQDKGVLIDAYPQLRDKALSEQLGLGMSSPSEMGRLTRDLVTSPMGYVNMARRRNRWLFSNIWLPPASYNLIPNDKSGNLRGKLDEWAPEGTRATYVAGELVDLQPENLSRCWAACRPEPADSLYTDPYFEDYIQGSDNINDAVNAITEAVHRSTSLIVYSPDVIDKDRLTQTAVLQGEFIPAKVSAPSDITKSFFRVPAAEVNSALFNYVDWYITKMREIPGITPAIFGGDMGGGQKTALEVSTQRSQALMKLNTVWNEMRSFWEATCENGAYWAAKCTGGTLYSSRWSALNQEVQQLIGLDELQSGGWFYHCEESMPMTVGQRRDFFMNAIQTATPLSTQILGLDLPGNLARAQEAIGSPDWEIRGLKERNRLVDILGQLTRLPMNPGLPDIMTGMPGPPQPAIPPDPLMFDPPFALQVVREWVNGDSGMEAENTNPEGFQHVLAYGRAWMAMMAPPPAPPGGPGGPPPPGTADQPAPANPLEAPAPQGGPPPPVEPPPPGVAGPTL